MLGNVALRRIVPRGLIDLVVDEGERAFAEFGFVVAAEGENRQRALAVESPLTSGNASFRQGEDDRDRLDLGDDDEAGLVGGVHDVALIDQPDAGAPVRSAR